MINISISRFIKTPSGRGVEIVDVAESCISEIQNFTMNNDGSTVIDYSIPEWGIGRIYMAFYSKMQIVAFEPHISGGIDILNRKVGSMEPSDIICYKWISGVREMTKPLRWDDSGQRYSVRPGQSKADYFLKYPHIETTRDIVFPAALVLKSGLEVVQFQFKKK